jgi:hypothetical protein
MRKNTLNFIVDLLTLIGILIMIGTGLIMRFPLPPGSGGRGLDLWGLGRHGYGGIHFWAAVALAALLILHVALHWAWVCGTTRRLVRGPSRGAGRPRGALDNLYGVAFLLVIAALTGGFVWIASLNVESSIDRALEHEREREAVRTIEPGQGRQAGDPVRARFDEPEPDSAGITGRMTVAEVADSTGLSVPEILAALELPDSIDPGERLGRLARAHDLEMSEIRKRIAGRASAMQDG